VFQTPNSGAAKKFGLDKAPERLIEIVHNAWVSFVTRGDPNHQDLPHWPTWQNHGLRPCMSFNETCSIDTFIDANTLEIWRAGK
jgi:carboxylesterase type B